MRIFKVLFCCLMTAGMAVPAFGHGFSLSLQGNTLVGTSNDYPGNGNPNLFLSELVLTSGQLRSTHGAAGTSLFGTGKSLSFDVHSALFYSNGDGLAAVPAGEGVSMLIESQNLLGTTSVDGSGSFTSGFPILGNSTHEFRWTLSSTTSLPEGVYGLAYRVQGGYTGGAEFEPTQLLVSTFMTPGFFPGEDPLAPNSPLSLALSAVYTAAITPVPEPGSVVLMLFGTAALSLAAWRKRRVRS